MKKLLKANAGAREKNHDAGDEKTPNKISSLSSHSPDVLSDSTMSSDEIGSPTKQSTNHTLEIQGINMLGIIHQETKVLEEIETFTSGEIETNDKMANSNLKSNEEACAKQYLIQVKSSDKSNLSRSKDETDGSGNIDNLSDGNGQSVEISPEVNELSFRDIATLDGGTSEESSDSLNHCKNVRIETQQNTSDGAAACEFSQSIILPKKEISEIDIKLKCSIQISSLMEDLYNTDNEISEMINAMLETKERMIQDLSSFQVTLSRLQFSLTRTRVVRHSGPAVEQTIGQICSSTLLEGDNLMQKLKVFKYVIEADIATWEIFRKEGEHLKEWLIERTSDCDYVYCNYNDSEEVRYNMQKLWSNMKICRQCRNHKDEEFLRFQIVLRSFLRLARVACDRYPSTSRKTSVTNRVRN